MVQKICSLGESPANFSESNKRENLAFSHYDKQFKQAINNIQCSKDHIFQIKETAN